MIQHIKSFVKRFPAATRWMRVLRHFPAYVAHKEYVQPGHFYSALPAFANVERSWERVMQASSIIHEEALNLNEQSQYELLQDFKSFYNEMPFPIHPASGFRYFFENPFYSYSDGLMLYCMMRHLRPKRVVEVGSGFSSALMLDTNDRFLDGATEFTFIEPNPERLKSLLRDADSRSTRILEQEIQTVDSAVFQELSAGDILFVDSSHVAKVGSDLNYIFFNVLPMLQSGVMIHFHDIHYPFEYPRELLADGVAYNEAYILRAFLSYNTRFEIVMFNTFMESRYESWFAEAMPLCLKNRGGSIWIQKL